MSTFNDFILTLSCPDRTGIVHAVSGFLLSFNGNIVDSQQFGDEETQHFFLRIHFRVAADIQEAQLRQEFTPLADKFAMHWQLHNTQTKSRVLILVSKQGHCLNDLLFRAHTGSLPVDIVGIASNHRDFEILAKTYNIPFHYLPVTNETREGQEAHILQLVDELKVDLVLLARYMQILSNQMCVSLTGKAINIHHSFLPSFELVNICFVSIRDSTI